MQQIAQSWLVLELTGSGTAIGVVVALQTLPILFLGPYGGVIADRVDKRKLMIVLQSLMGVQGARPRATDGDPLGAAMGGVRPRNIARAEQHVREPSASAEPFDA